MDINPESGVCVTVKTRPESDTDLSNGFTGNLHAHRAAQGDHAFVDDTVINLYTFSSLAQHARLVQGVEVLGHIGLGGVDLGQEFTHVFFAIAKRADDAQPHGCGHDPKNFGGFFKHLLRFGQRVVFCWGGLGHGVFAWWDSISRVGFSAAYKMGLQAMAEADKDRAIADQHRRLKMNQPLLWTILAQFQTIDWLFAYAKNKISQVARPVGCMPK